MRSLCKPSWTARCFATLQFCCGHCDRRGDHLSHWAKPCHCCSLDYPSGNELASGLPQGCGNEVWKFGIFASSIPCWISLLFEWYCFRATFQEALDWMSEPGRADQLGTWNWLYFQYEILRKSVEAFGSSSNGVFRQWRKLTAFVRNFCWWSNKCMVNVSTVRDSQHDPTISNQTHVSVCFQHGGLPGPQLDCANTLKNSIPASSGQHGRLVVSRTQQKWLLLKRPVHETWWSNKHTGSTGSFFSFLHWPLALYFWFVSHHVVFQKHQQSCHEAWQKLHQTQWDRSKEMVTHTHTHHQRKQRSTRFTFKSFDRPSSDFLNWWRWKMFEAAKRGWFKPCEAWRVYTVRSVDDSTDIVLTIQRPSLLSDESLGNVILWFYHILSRGLLTFVFGCLWKQHAQTFQCWYITRCFYIFFSISFLISFG